jgi:Tc toxin complex TcA C-terminal TcB-binding domain/Neuraminidase-like domain/Salmonella virulence plasmid 28.1kDa A protein
MQDSVWARIADGTLADIPELNPGFDLRTFDFHDPDAVAKLNPGTRQKAAVVAKLKIGQRLMLLDAAPEAMAALEAEGLISAHHVAALPEHALVRRLGERGIAAPAAAAVYRRALKVRAAAQHLFINVKDLVASPYFRATRASPAARSLDSAAQAIPSYQDLFGSLNFLTCDQCASIFGPPAYFLDLMRLVDDYVTSVNQIPPPFGLRERRPDLFELRLTCENALDTVPYLAIVDRVLERRLGAEPYKTLAAAPYPFNLPFNLPLVEIRSNLDALGSSLAAIYTCLRVDGIGAATGELAAAREVLGLSIEQYGLVITELTSGQALGPYFGYPDITPAVLTELSDVELFSARTGLSRADIVALLYQETLDAERAAVAPAFFINRTNEASAPPFMSLVVDPSDLKKVERIRGLTLLRLDRINRFVRLAAILGWSFADLDWALKAVAAETLAPAIIPFAATKQLMAATGLGVDELAGYWYQLKNIGRGTARTPVDPFDQVFNSPSLLHGGNPYKDAKLPFDPARADPWSPQGGTTNATTIRSRLDAALALSDDDLTRAADCVIKATKPPGDILALDLVTLSALYRLAGMARAVALPMAEYCVFLDLVYRKHGPPRCAKAADGHLIGAPEGPRLLAKELATAAWMRSANVSAFEIDYVATGDGHGYVDPGYVAGDIHAFVDSLAAVSAVLRIGSQSFVYAEIDAEKSTALFGFLTAPPPGGTRYLTELGILTAAVASFAVIAPHLPVSEADLVTDLISATEAAAAFQLLIANQIILASAGATSGPLSAGFDDKTSLDFLFSGGKAQEKRDQVREILLANRQAVRHTLGVLEDGRSMQTQSAVEILGGFLSAPQANIKVLLAMAAKAAALPGYLAALLTPLAASAPVPDALAALISRLARGVFLMRAIDLAPAEMQAVFDQPLAFGIADPNALTIDDIGALFQFKTLVRRFRDTDGSLLRYFALPATADRATTLQALARLSMWPNAQIKVLAERFWPTPTDTAYATVAGVTRLDAVFGPFAGTGLDANTLIELFGLANLPLVINGKVDDGNWTFYQRAAAMTLSSIAAKFSEPQFSEINGELTDRLVERKRDALLGFTLASLGRLVPGIRSPADLFQYLLIDVEMTGCDKISPIAQGIGSLQLYLQRCHLNLEPGVVKLPIPEIWWEWISTYRVWEANRKVFLYPENYLDPSLRTDRTPEFSGLMEALQQNDVTDATVADAYQGYMQGFAGLASLKIVSTCHAAVTDPSGGRTVDTLFMFGRTNDAPYTYYLRRCEGFTIAIDPKTQKASTRARWRPWEKLDQTITSPWVTGCYAFGRPMVFWVDVKRASLSSIADQKSKNQYFATADLKFSFPDLKGQWISPQTMAQDLVINFDPDDYLTKSDYAPLLDPANLIWHKVYPLRVPAGHFTQVSPFDVGEQLLLLYGPVRRYTPLSIGLDKPAETDFPQANRINTDVWLSSHREEDMGKTPAPSSNGLIVFETSSLIAANLARKDLFIAVLNREAGFGPEISGRELFLKPFFSILSADLIADSHIGSRSQEPPRAGLAADGGPPPAAAGAAAGPGLVLWNVATTNVSVLTTKNQPGWFVFDNGDDVFLATAQFGPLKTVSETLTGTTDMPQLPAGIVAIANAAYSPQPVPPLDTMPIAFTRLGTNTVTQLSQTLLLGGIPELLTLRSQQAPERHFTRFFDGQPPARIIDTTINQLDFDGAYGPYFWEIFFHAVFLVAETLRANRKFAAAKGWYEYVFNPTAKPDPNPPPNPNDVYWQFLPFRGRTWQSLIEILTDVGQITAYNDTPLDPHAIARLRPSAYPKAIVMRYIDNLLDWADALFTEDTRETITQATNLYVLAAELLGPRPQDVGSLPPRPALSFDDIRAAYAASGTARGGSATSVILATTASDHNYFYNGLTVALTGGTGAGQTRTVSGYDGASRTATVSRAWDQVPDSTTTYQMSGIPQFLIELEHYVPSTTCFAPHAAAAVPFNSIDAYFCVPENDELIGYWDRVEDRLFKIRNCMNIHGQVRQLALYAPPLDVRALVRAAASGALAPSIAGGAAETVPFYRFAVMVERAKTLAGAVMGLGSSMLAALQQMDGEALALLRNVQELVILNLTTKLRNDRIAELAAQRDALVQSRAAATERSNYYSGLVAGGLSDAEQTNLDAMAIGFGFNLSASAVKAAAGIAYAIPQVGSPFAMTYGGQQLGNSLNAISGVLEIGSVIASYIAQRSLTMAGYARRTSDWQLQATLAIFDIAQIDAQLAANDVGTAMAEQELTIHLKSIDQNNEVADFLKRKFTSKELYQWLAGRLSAVHFQTYALAYDLARAAQRAYQFEINTNDTFINFGYWDTLHKGLVAGEGLMLALNQMEAAYVAKSPRPLEIQRTISLLQLDPVALIALRNTGECIFALPERLFDQDYPGHYARKIKTLSVTLPLIIGPSQNVKATLTQTSNQVALTDSLRTVRYLLGVDQGAAPGAAELRTDWWINQQVALSSGVNDQGLFQLDFQDSRYLPFEGTGAVSSWHFRMPKAANRIDFSAISDVLIQLSYTAFASETLRKSVITLAPVKNYEGSRFIALAQQFADRWYAFMRDHSDPVHQTMTITLPQPLGPPQVAVTAIVRIAVHLEVKDGLSAAGATYLGILFPGDATPTPIKIDANNNGAVDKRLTRLTGDWSISFALGTGQAPDTITSGGFLDPAKLLDLGLVIYYAGTLDWTDPPPSKRISTP